jgi:hypothetical protein
MRTYISWSPIIFNWDGINCFSLVSYLTS